LKKLLHNRFGFINLIFIIFLIISAITRTTLLFKSIDSVDLNIIQIFEIYLVGVVNDLAAISYFVIPIVIYLLLVPKKYFKHKIHKYMTYSFTYFLLFSLIFYSFSEWFFWNEFSVRFNFIAVDYLVYTSEVIGNIRESYPMGILISIISILSSVIFLLLIKFKVIKNILQDDTNFKNRIKLSIFYLLMPLVFFIGISENFSKISQNNYNNELSKDGLYAIFTAFRNNTLDYDAFYITHKEKNVLSKLREIVKAKDSTQGILRKIKKSGKENNYNIMMIVVESLSGEYLESLNGGLGFTGYTPKLDKLSKKSIFFDNFYATGTRTIRGMEAITLSVPPTAGRSIVKRPDNHNMFSSGFIFRDKGYDTKFIYGGHGYFDNMNEFFSNNGFDIVDRSDFSEKEDTFHTVWGVCDEDLLAKVSKEADKSYAKNKPFMSFVMTTSNHRPYDFPNGKIDLKSHSGRKAAVKYTDFAIGKFLKDAESKPWFKNTIFVIVADHCASSAGKSNLPLNKYQIPLFIYAPDIIEPKRVSKLSSQIDIMPTIFSILNWSYDSKFYGQDILDKDFNERALLGTYQLLGLYKDNILTYLSPGKKIHSNKATKISNIFFTVYDEVNVTKESEEDIVSYYQGANLLHKEHLDRYKVD